MSGSVSSEITGEKKSERRDHASSSPTGEASKVAPQSDTSLVALFSHFDNKLDRESRRFEQKLDKGLKTITNRSLWALLVLVAGGGTGVIYGYIAILESAKKAVSTRLDQEFSSDKIQGSITDAARKFTSEKASSLIKSQIESGLKLTGARIDAASKSTSSRLAEMEHNSEQRLEQIKKSQDQVAKSTEEQRQIIDSSANIYALAAQAANGSYPAYGALVSLAASNKKLLPLVELNLGELNILIRTYMSPGPVPVLLNMTVTENGKQIDAKTLSIDQLMSHMEFQAQPESQRQFLASILASKPAKNLVGPAIQAFRGNRSIYVLATLFGTLGETGHFRGVNFYDKPQILSLLERLQSEQTK